MWITIIGSYSTNLDASIAFKSSSPGPQPTLSDPVYTRRFHECHGWWAEPRCTELSYLCMAYCKRKKSSDERNLDKSDWHGGVTLLLYLCLQSDIGDPVSPGGGDTLTRHHRGRQHACTLAWSVLSVCTLTCLRTHTQTNIKDATQRPGFKQRGGILLRYFKALPSFWGKIGSPAPFPIFPPQQSFNQPMQMLYLSPLSLSTPPSLYLSIYLGRSLLSPLLASQ